MQHTIFLRIRDLPDGSAKQIAAGYAAILSGAVKNSSVAVQGDSAGWVAAVHSVGELEQGLLRPRSALHRWRRQLEYRSVPRGVLVLASGSAVELLRLVVPGEPAYRICPKVRAKGVQDAFGPSCFGRSEHVHNSIAGRVASAVGDAVDVPASVENQIAVRIAAGGCGSAERIQDRLCPQLTAGGWNELVQGSLVERAAERCDAIQVSERVQEDGTTGRAGVTQIAEGVQHAFGIGYAVLSRKLVDHAAVPSAPPHRHAVECS